MMATRYQRLDYRDYSASELLKGIESGIRANWRQMHYARKEREKALAAPYVMGHRFWMNEVSRSTAILRELLEIRRDAR